MIPTARRVSLKDWATLHSALARNVSLCHVLSSAFVAASWQRLKECLEGSDGCVTCLETFKTVCLDKDVLYTALVTMHTVRGDEVETPITNR